MIQQEARLVFYVRSLIDHNSVVSAVPVPLDSATRCYADPNSTEQLFQIGKDRSAVLLIREEATHAARVDIDDQEQVMNDPLFFSRFLSTSPSNDIQVFRLAPKLLYDLV